MVICVLQAIIVLKAVKSPLHVHQSGAESEADCETCSPGYYCPPGHRLMLTTSVLQGGSVHRDPHLDISQSSCVQLVIHAHLVVPPPPSVTLVIFSLHQDSPYVTFALQVLTVWKGPWYHPLVHWELSTHQWGGGSGSAKPCPSGTFLSEVGALSSSECHLCPPGKYCLGPGAPQPNGLCFPGFFCVGGSETPTPIANASLFECFHQVVNLYSNLDDTFQMNNQTFSNFSSPARDDSWIEVEPEPEAVLDNIGTHRAPCVRRPHYACTSYKGDICPEGFFCPLGMSYPLLCPAGFYCNQTGLEAPAGPCVPGFFCPKGSIDTYSTPCPQGHFCPVATSIPLPCPAGTVKDLQGGATVEACRPCPPGHYCHSRGQTGPSGLCAEGYYCPGGQTSPMPQQHVCSVGHFCKKGSFIESPCAPGSYQFRHGQGSCEVCPPGFYCQAPGTYGNMSGFTEEKECLLCDPGKYCKGAGRTDPSGPCAEGFVCNKGASEPSPADGLTGKPCPPGFFCSVGTSAPQPCPKGTYSNKGGLVDVSQCKSCIPGFYCSEPGLSIVSGPCLPGFYCLEGSSTATPISGISGDVCPQGHYCLEGSSVPIACPPGSYQNHTGGVSKDDCKPCPYGQFQDLSGQKDCNPCPPGFHCQAISLSPSRGNSNGVSTPEPCPAGYTCPRESPDSQPVPCSKGTYSQNMGLTILGQFCGSDGLVEPSGPCDSGYLCVIGATVPNPMDNKTGSLCPPGYFCKQGLRAGECMAGYFCDWGSSKSDEALCPAGFFCPRVHQHLYHVLLEPSALSLVMHTKKIAPPVYLDTTVKVKEQCSQIYVLLDTTALQDLHWGQSFHVPLALCRKCLGLPVMIIAWHALLILLVCVTLDTSVHLDQSAPTLVNPRPILLKTTFALQVISAPLALAILVLALQALSLCLMESEELTDVIPAPLGCSVTGLH
ncbi:hypothetical protein WMY93_028726 [Mugilogobius chulae]|uniref:Uncharacterized protein n=1 Tax=Mugilogobius chulae TaxID=88201 RepID=A0AAW0MTT7_9GOBI